MSSSNQDYQCNRCKKPTTMICHRCKIGMCATHSYSINHHLYCAKCFLHVRNVGMVKIWGILGAIIVVVIIILKTQPFS